MPTPVRLPPSVERPLVAADRAGDRALDAVRGRRGMDRLFYTASALADHSVLWHGIGAARAMQGTERRVHEAVRLSGALAAESALVNLGVKSLFRRTRPVQVDERPLALRRPRTSSFPSGHASAAFCAATLLSDDDRRMAPLWYSLAAVVSLSRVYVRIHHLSDVLVGAAVGIVIGRAVRRLVPLSQPAEPEATAAP